MRHELTHVEQYLHGQLQRPGSGLEVTEPGSAVETQASERAHGPEGPAPDASATAPSATAPSATAPLAPSLIAREGPNVKPSIGGVWNFHHASRFCPDEELDVHIENTSNLQARIAVSFGPHARGTI